VKIDRTAPATALSGTSNTWTNGDVTVNLSGSDNLSGVASTSYSIDGGEQRTGTSFTLSNEGDHTVTFFSTDKAGNAEKPKTAEVKVERALELFNGSALAGGSRSLEHLPVPLLTGEPGEKVEEIADIRTD
jgi:hypothetical protein